MHQKKDKKVKIGITHGDYNGIGYELILKSFLDKRILGFFVPVIYGSSKLASYYRKTLKMPELSYNIIRDATQARANKPNLINITNEELKIEMGKIDEKAGEMAHLALEKAVEDLQAGKIDVLVTAPIHKQSIHSDKFDFPGHTEFLTKKCHVKTDGTLMIMLKDKLRIAMATGHIPIREIAETITEELLSRKLHLFEHSLQKDFGIQKPKIAVLGLNPHAGDQGVIGDEDSKLIRPTIKKLQDEGMHVFGPYPSDGLFGSGKYTEFDGILAMYHDQGMLPFKLLAFDDGVNYTAGLPIVRTSPAHGTAFDIVGKNKADIQSFRNALYTALEIYHNRHNEVYDMK
jgi:4-hydroxythreonine-4-phosphate dehydrogenase